MQRKAIVSPVTALISSEFIYLSKINCISLPVAYHIYLRKHAKVDQFFSFTIQLEINHLSFLKNFAMLGVRRFYTNNFELPTINHFIYMLCRNCILFIYLRMIHYCRLCASRIILTHTILLHSFAEFKMQFVLNVFTVVH